MKKVFFITGSQRLYGEEIFSEITAHSTEIADYLSKKLPAEVVTQKIVTNKKSISDVFKMANNDDDCIGVITWMHTFSPSKMWIEGFKILQKPLLQFSTQYNRDIPWSTIDMDFMNLNQSAHGDRELGFITSRMNLKRKVVVGFWKDEKTISKIDCWVRAAIGKSECDNLNIVRFGDNMRNVAVTDGNKVSAEIDLGWSVNGFGVGDLVKYINMVTESQIDKLMTEYEEKYIINTKNIEAIREQAKYEIAIEAFLNDNQAKAFTTTFEDLHGLKQLPGLACQRLMEKGYGFGGEGDWKTSALTRIMKKMASGIPGGTSFIEDYTYHFEHDNEMILGSHMLEVCPSVSCEKPKIEVHDLGIGNKNPPARMVFNGISGDAICVTIIDMGNRFRMIIQDVTLFPIKNKMPNLPVARLLWKPMPNLNEGATDWILAGGAHHSCISTSLKSEHLIDLADMLGIETIVIDKNTNTYTLRKELQMNEIIWRLK
ncbi:MAG: L-arabinose isomerase [Oscillospiraceae bacterium]